MAGSLDYKLSEDKTQKLIYVWTITNVKVHLDMVRVLTRS